MPKTIKYTFVYIFYVWVILCMGQAFGEEVTASWYSVESCKREGTLGIMANGEVLNDNALTCASWDYDYGTILLVRNLENGKTVKCVVTDRGPAKRLYRLGRKIDLAKAAFNRIADLKQGIIPVSIVMVAE